MPVLSASLDVTVLAFVERLWLRLASTKLSYARIISGEIGRRLTKLRLDRFDFDRTVDSEGEMLKGRDVPMSQVGDELYCFFSTL